MHHNGQPFNWTDVPNGDTIVRSCSGLPNLFSHGPVALSRNSAWSSIGGEPRTGWPRPNTGVPRSPIAGHARADTINYFPYGVQEAVWGWRRIVHDDWYRCCCIHVPMNMFVTFIRIVLPKSTPYVHVIEMPPRENG